MTKKKCKICNYEWDAIVEHPKECPKCKGRQDRGKGYFK